MDLIGELIGYFFTYCVFRPLLFACQSVAGLLASDLTPRNRPVQIFGLVTLVLGCGGLLFCFVGPPVGTQTLLWVYVGAFTALFISALIGRHLEKTATGSDPNSTR